MSYNRYHIGNIKNYEIINIANKDTGMFVYCNVQYESSNLMYEHTIYDLTEWLDKNKIQLSEAQKLLTIINKFK